LASYCGQRFSSLGFQRLLDKLAVYPLADVKSAADQAPGFSLFDAIAKAVGQERVDTRRGGKVQILRLQLFEKQRLRDLALLRHLGGPGVAIGRVADFRGVLHQHVNDLLGRLRPGVNKRLRAEEPA
jgi:hypothetical protein